MNHPLASILGPITQENDERHPLAPEAQIANLKEAWEYYRTPKVFSPGEIVRCRQGLSIFNNEPVILLFVRVLQASEAIDLLQIEDAISRNKWNKVDCMVMMVLPTGGAFIIPFDCDILEAVPT